MLLKLRHTDLRRRGHLSPEKVVVVRAAATISRERASLDGLRLIEKERFRVRGCMKGRREGGKARVRPRARVHTANNGRVRGVLGCVRLCAAVLQLSAAHISHSTNLELEERRFVLHVGNSLVGVGNVHLMTVLRVKGH